MWGQWVGNMTGALDGFITLNIDHDSSSIGRLLFVSQIDKYKSFYANAKITSDKQKFILGGASGSDLHNSLIM